MGVVPPKQPPGEPLSLEEMRKLREEYLRNLPCEKSGIDGRAAFFLIFLLSLILYLAERSAK